MNNMKMKKNIWINTRKLFKHEHKGSRETGGLKTSAVIGCCCCVASAVIM